MAAVHDVVRQLGKANVRRKVGTMMQEDVLLTGCIADNNAFFDMAPDQQRIEACGQLAQLHLDIGNEQAVNAVLAQMPFTRIVIAHRPETIASTQRQWALTSAGLLYVTATQSQ